MVLENFKQLHIEKLELFGNPCSKEENYKGRVLEILGCSLKIFDRHALTKEDFIIKEASSSSSREELRKTIAFGKTFTLPKKKDKVGMLTETIRDLEERCKCIRQKRKALEDRNEQTEKREMEEQFRKAYEESIPKDEEPEENIYDTIKNQYIQKNSSKQNVTRKDVVKTFWINNKKKGEYSHYLL
jgi:hypothetical protein